MSVLSTASFPTWASTAYLLHCSFFSLFRSIPLFYIYSSVDYPSTLPQISSMSGNSLHVMSLDECSWVDILEFPCVRFWFVEVKERAKVKLMLLPRRTMGCFLPWFLGYVCSKYWFLCLLSRFCFSSVSWVQFLSRVSFDWNMGAAQELKTISWMKLSIRAYDSSSKCKIYVFLLPSYAPTFVLTLISFDWNQLHKGCQPYYRFFLLPHLCTDFYFIWFNF